MSSTVTFLLILLGAVTAHARSIDHRSILAYLESTPEGSKSCGEGPLDRGSARSREPADNQQDFKLQQLLLAGFRNYKLNSYNIRQPEGFTSDGGERQCIAVKYNITCDSNAEEICASMRNNSCINSDEWIFIRTVFNARSATGSLLMRITVYDLRVFGFQLCDVYKPTISISIDLASEDYMPQTCYDICKALSDFTTLVSIIILL